MTDEHVMVRVTGRQFRHDGEEYHTGDTLEVPERAISGWEARLERVDEDEDESEDGGDGAESESGDGDDGEAGEELDPHPGDLTIDELESRLGDVDDPQLLHVIRDAEEAADDREGAKDAIDSRLSELQTEE